MDFDKTALQEQVNRLARHVARVGDTYLLEPHEDGTVHINGQGALFAAWGVPEFSQAGWREFLSKAVTHPAFQGAPVIEAAKLQSEQYTVMQRGAATASSAKSVAATMLTHLLGCSFEEGLEFLSGEVAASRVLAALKASCEPAARDKWLTFLSKMHE